MRNILANLGCLVLSILFLPIFLIFIGPLLVLAALRGRQPVGPIMLDTLRYGPFGRIGAFMLGLAVWILVWSGLVWVVVNGLLPASTVANVAPSPTRTLLAESPVPAQPQVDTEDSVTTEQNNVTPPTSTATVTPTPLSPTAIPSSTSTPTVLVIIDPTATLDLTPSLTITPTANTPEPTLTPTLGRSTVSDRVDIDKTEVLTAPLSMVDQQDVIATVEEANLLLREAISLANQENVQKLGKVWQGEALDKAQDFVTDLYERYVKPFEVEFEYIAWPTVSSQSTLNQAIVISRETWIYQGRSGTDREAFEFTYTLKKEDEHWLITKYGYRNLPAPTPIPTGTPAGSIQ